jgi:putative DNA primase/helicase
MDWQQYGLTEPKDVANATKDYRAEMDILSAFLNEECTPSPGSEVSKKVLYAAYRVWARESEEYMMSKSMFSRRMVERGWEEHRLGTDRLWRGLELGTPAQQEEPTVLEF